MGLNAQFDRAVPAFQLKRDNLGVDEREGILYLGKPAETGGSSKLYDTRLEQALMLWAIATALFFHSSVPRL